MIDCSSKGFSVIEILVATTLAAMLMIATLGLSSSISKTNKIFEKIDSEPAWVTQFCELLQWDLANATKIQTGKNKIILEGYGTLDRRHYAPNHSRVRVTYILKKLGEHNWVVREQEKLDDLTNRNRWADFVCTGVASFQAKTIYPKEKKNSATDKDSVPSRVRLILQLNSEDKSPYEKDFILK